jgi:acetyl-CoA decarbonylase/synthase complex subunit gamma
VAAFSVKQYSGFSVQYGPVMLEDLPVFLKNGNKALPGMRIKDFPFQERFVLIPVEIMQALRQGLPVILFYLCAAGILANDSFLNTLAVHGLPPSLAILCGIVSGTILTPLLLPWIPGKAFSIKGALCGLLLFLLVFVPLYGSAIHYSSLEKGSWLFICLAVSSWFGMAFTGASTFTSLNGVRKEMLIGMPLQFISLVGGTIMWLTSLWLIR